MSYLHLSRSRTRDISPTYDRPLPLIRRPRIVTPSDDDEDDYPYSASHRPSRALTLRNQPSQLERYNIWSDRHRSSDRDEGKTYEHEHEHERSRTYRHRHRASDDDFLRSDPEERDFRLKVQATFSSPRHRQISPPTETWRRKDKIVDEGWEVRERSRSGERDGFWGDDGFWGSEGGEEKWRRYRKVKKTRTEEWRPLSGWRRV